MKKYNYIVFLLVVFLFISASGCKQKAKDEAGAQPGANLNTVTDVVITPQETEGEGSSTQESLESIEGGTAQESPETEEKNQKEGLGIFVTYTSMDKDELLQTGELILRGTVTASDGGFMTNPDQTLCDQEGNPIPNQQVTTYTIEVDEVFKGDYTQDTIEVAVCNGHGLSPELILYGEDDRFVLNGWSTMFLYFEQGKEAVFVLKYAEEITEDKSGYVLVHSQCAYLPKDENGTYSTTKWTPKITLDAATLESEIEALQ